MNRTVLSALALLGALGCTVAAAQSPELTALLEQLRSDNGDAREQAELQLAEVGAEAIAPLFAMMDDPNPTVDLAARNAVHWLVQRSSRPDAEAQRKAVAAALAAQAASDRSQRVRSYALTMLSYVAGSEEIPQLVALLRDPNPRIAEYARFALARTPGQAAEQALLTALTGATGALKVGLINALADRGSPAAAEAVRAATADADGSVRMAAMEALGRIPEAASEPVLRAAMEQGGQRWQGRARNAYLRLADTLAQAGEQATAQRMYRWMYDQGPTAADRAAGLVGLSKIGGDETLRLLLAALGDAEADVRGAAKQALVDVPGEEATGALAAALEGADGERAALLLWALGERRDATALDAVVAAASRPEEAVQVAAFDALGKLGQAEAVPGLVAALGQAQGAARDAAERALNRIPGTEATRAIIAALDGAAPPVRAILVRALGTRRDAEAAPPLLAALQDADEEVRIAALEGLSVLRDPASVPDIIAAWRDGSQKQREAAESTLTEMTAPQVTQRLRAALQGAPDEVRAMVLRALAPREDPGLAQVFVAAARDRSDDVAAAALDGLARLKDPAAESLFLDIAENGTAATKPAALRGYLQLADARREREAPAARAMYHRTLELATTDEDRRAALAGVAAVGDAGSLPYVRPLLEAGNVRDAAAAAVVPIAVAMAEAGQREEALALLRQVVEVAQDRDALRSASHTLRELGVDMDLAAQGGYITHWCVIGPFPGRDDQKKQNAVAPTEPVDLAKPVQVGDGTLAWRYAFVDDPLGMQDLEQAIARQDDVGAFAYAEVTSDREQEVLLRIGSDDDVYVWLNGEQVHAFDGNRGWSQDQDTARATLQAGTNRLLLKVLNGGAQWSYSVRVTDLDGKPLPLQQWEPVAATGFVASWWVIGPFADRAKQRDENAVAPDQPVDLEAPVAYGDRSYVWRYTPLQDLGGVLDLRAAVAAEDNVGAFAYAEVTSDRAQDVLLKTGSDDDITVWLNGELVHQVVGDRGYKADQDTVPARLQAGVNPILVKVLNGAADWGLSLRLTDADGNALRLESKRPGG